VIFTKSITDILRDAAASANRHREGPEVPLQGSRGAPVHYRENGFLKLNVEHRAQAAASCPRGHAGHHRTKPKR